MKRSIIELMSSWKVLLFSFFLNKCKISPGISLFLMVLFSAGCSGEKSEIIFNNDNTYEMNENEWNILSGKKIFFGHQSVGNNIIDGIVSLQNASNSSVFRIIETRDSSAFNNPLFAHSRLGKNSDPVSKIDDFVNVMESGLSSYTDIALMKLCYVDITRSTRITELFKYYQTSVNKLKTNFPELKIIHCTVPLTTKPEGLKGLIRMILKMDDNVYRQRYNQLIREYYNKSEIFDIATIESTYQNGSRNIYNNGTPGLISDYSSDDGHLNEKGSRLIGSNLLLILYKTGQ